MSKYAIKLGRDKYFTSRHGYDSQEGVPLSESTKFASDVEAIATIKKLMRHDNFGSALVEVNIETGPTADVVPTTDSDEMEAVDSETTQQDVTDAENELDQDIIDTSEEDNEQSITQLELEMMDLKKLLVGESTTMPAKPKDNLESTKPVDTPVPHYTPLATPETEIKSNSEDITASAMSITEFPKLPSSFFNLLSATIKNLHTDGQTLDTFGDGGYNVKLTAASALEEIQELLKTKDVDNFKRAQIVMAGLQSPAQTEIPAEIRQILLSGRATRKLTDIYHEVRKRSA